MTPKGNGFLHLAKKRKTTYEFSATSPKDSDLNKILEAGRWAPSCSNSQAWNFVIIKDKKKISKLVGLANYGDFHQDAPVLIAFVLVGKLCSGKDFACFHGKESNTHDSYMSLGMAALNMALEAEDLGIDSCLITPSRKGIKELLKISKDDDVPLLLGLGYKKKGAFQKKRTRRDIQDVTSYEYYGGKK